MFFSRTSSFSFVENCYTSAHVPGKKIKNNLGVVQYSINGCRSNQTKEMEKIFINILDYAKKKGANAVLNININCGTYQDSGGGAIMSFLTVFGDAVILEPDEN